MTLRSLFVKLGFKTDLSGLDQFEKRIDGSKSSMMALTAAVTASVGIIGKFIYEAAKIEQVQVAFNVMTGSAEIGKKTLNDLFEFARYTPFEIPQVIKSATMLTAMKVKTEDLIEVIGQVGDVASGIPTKPFEELADAFGKVNAAGIMTGEELRQLRRHGVGIMDELMKLTGKSYSEVMHMVREQQITSAMFKKAWRQMADESGHFNHMMLEQSKTLLGLWNNVKDSILISMIKSGEALLPTAKKITLQIYDMLDANKELINLKLTQFFSKVSRIMDIMHKSSLYLFSDIRSMINSLGGLNRVVQVLSFLLTMYFGSHALMLVGKIATMSISFLTLANVKLMIIGAAFIFLLLVVTDFFGYLEGKESVLDRFLNYFEKKFPNAFKSISASLKALKKEIEGITLYWLGFITGDKKMMSFALSQMSEAYNMFQEEGKRRDSDKTSLDYSAKGFINQPAKMLGVFGSEVGEYGKEKLSGLWEGWKDIIRINQVPYQGINPGTSMPLIQKENTYHNITTPLTVNINSSSIEEGDLIEQKLLKTITSHIKKEIGQFAREEWSSVESRQY